MSATRPETAAIAPEPETPVPDRGTTKRRPALILSDAGAFGNRAGHSVLAMITTRRNSRWPLDVAIEDGASAGLSAPSIVRMKLFTLDHRLILRKIGRLGEADARKVEHSLKKLLRPLTTQPAVESTAHP